MSFIKYERSVIIMTLFRLDYLIYSLSNCTMTLSYEIGWPWECRMRGEASSAQGGGSFRDRARPGPAPHDRNWRVMIVFFYIFGRTANE